jgi:cytochrome c peroxidase
MGVTAPPVAPAKAPGGGQTRAEVYRAAERMTALGRRMFSDPSLSGSGKRSCASCHSPRHAFGPPNKLSVQLGGGNLRSTGIRAVPGLKYLQTVPQFSEHYHESDDEGDESVDAGPTGGLTWDGRVDHGADQARIPLLSPFEMAGTPGQIVAAVKRAPYAAEFRQAFGPDIFLDEQKAFASILMSFQTFEQSPPDFYPYSSKYDAFLAGTATLKPAEARGLQLFNDENKGNCASCHVSRRAKDGTPPQFTDFGLIAIGVPRNQAIPANRNPAFFDLGACGPERTDLREQAQYCGLFRTPTLRNVALRKTFFHNGRVHSLEKAIRFYVERDTAPGKWYPRKRDGTVHKFDDLPPRYLANLNSEPPFGGQAGGAPALSAAEIKDVAAFLGTLTDGYHR